MPALAGDAHPVASSNAFLFRQHLADFDELLRLGHGVDRTVFGPEVEVLGEPVRGGSVREVLGLPQRVPDRIEHPPRRVADRLLVVRVQRVDPDGCLERFVMLRERPFGHFVEGKEARYTLGVHDERIHPGFRRHIDLEVWHVGTAPGFAVPPHQTLFRRPGFALHIRRCPVVENPPVGRPRPSPAQVLLHAEWVSVVAPGHLVALLGPATTEDPATRGGTAIVLELCEAGQLLPGLDRRPAGISDVCDCVAVELLGNFFRGRLVGHLIRPVELEN
ncbi:hypothetical protein D3C79_696840 [compost metagenome]